jgi:putative cell wall-binding protein
MRTGRRSLILAMTACLTLGIALLVPVGASADLPASTVDEPTVEVMDEYTETDYVDEAAALPESLIESLQRDVDQTGEQYLAQADAAVQAVDVVDSLEAAGVDVLGSRLEETTLVVNVETSAEAEIVSSAGAVPEFGEPAPFELGVDAVSLAADVYDGQGYFWNDGTFNYQCSVGFHGFSSTGSPQFVTAGHCLDGSNPIQGVIRTLNQAGPGQAIVAANHGSPIGSEVAATQKFGVSASGFDVARVSVDQPGAVAKPSVATWGYGSGAPLSTPSVAVTGMTEPVVGATLCRSGSRSGWRCGPIVATDIEQGFDPDGSTRIEDNPATTPVETPFLSGDEFDIVSVVARLCAIPGDSGGSALVGTMAVGITSWTTNPNFCSTSDFSGYFQMISPGGLASVSSAYGSSWELDVAVATPVITWPTSTATTPTAITGTLSGASAGSTVSIYIDGSSTPVVTVDASSGSWYAPISAVADGLHKFTAVARYGNYSTSAAASGAFSKNVTVDRLAGADRYTTGIAVGSAAYAAPVPVLFLASGQNYPDALSAGPAAAHLGGPLMLIQPGGLSGDVLNAIIALQPTKVYILGAEQSVSAFAESQVRSAVPSSIVERLSGASRYDTSRAIAREAFLENGGSGSNTVYISNGGNFPDALSAGAAAGRIDAPVIMVQGSASSVPPETIQLIQALGATNIIVTGGPSSVSDAIYAQLAGLGTIQRYQGPDRYATSVAINSSSFAPTQNRALIATGLNYPDALAGSALAGSFGGPLYIAPGSCILSSTFDDLIRLKVTHITLLGGVGSLSNSVASLTRC